MFLVWADFVTQTFWQSRMRGMKISPSSPGMCCIKQRREGPNAPGIVLPAASGFEVGLLVIGATSNVICRCPIMMMDGVPTSWTMNTREVADASHKNHARP